MAPASRNPGCTACPLHAEANTVCLWGTGPKRAKVMIVGEAPGFTEDKEGKPFVGAAGDVVTELLKACGYSRRDVYITNTVKCRPPSNRTPKRSEVTACAPYLEDELEHVQPEYVLLLGSVAVKAFLGSKASITKARGSLIEWGGRKLFATYHPAAVLRDPGKEPVLKADFQRFFDIVDGTLRDDDSDFRWKLVTTSDDFEEYIQDLSVAEIVTVDVETTGLNPYEEGADIITFQTHHHASGINWVVPLGHKSSIFRKGRMRELAYELIDEAWGDQYTVAHNGKFDAKWLSVIAGIEKDIDFDTMLADHVLDENRRHGLKELASVFFGAADYDIAVEAKQGRMSLDSLAEYAARDTYYTYRLFLRHEKELEKDSKLVKLFYEVVMPVANMYRKIEENGVYVDRDRLQETKAYLEQKLADVQAQIEKYAPGLNVNSPKQVAERLFTDLGLSPLEYTSSGNPATSESVLQRLSEHHELPRLILEARGVSKFLSTFVNSWMESMDEDSRLHPTFKVHGTVTGRPSCAEPNLQQVPRDKTIRSLVTAPPGWTFVEADYSQVELRVAAALAREKNMLRIFREGGDIHSATAERVVGYSAEQVSPEQWAEARKSAKAVNFGFLYGMGHRKFKDYARDSYGIILTEEEAEAFRTRFFDLYPGLPAWHDKQIRRVQQLGYVRTLLGRRRRLPDVFSRDFSKQRAAERQSINSPVQGFAAELTLVAALEIHETFPHTDVRLSGTVHDAILMEVRDEVLADVLPQIKRIMENPVILENFGVKLPVPLEAELTTGHWGAGIEWHEED